MTNQWAAHTHHASVVRTAGSRQGCTVDKMTAVAAAARKNAIIAKPKPYGRGNEEARRESEGGRCQYPHGNSHRGRLRSNQAGHRSCATRACRDGNARPAWRRTVVHGVNDRE